jgi:preprotein translocase subunit Sec61beta
MKTMTQLISSYHWDNRRLGPVTARAGLADLFEEKAYATIKRTPEEVVYQLYLLGEIVDECVKDLASSRKYVDELAGYFKFALFALIVKALKAGDANFGDPRMHKLLERRRGVPREWLKLCKSGIDVLRAAYRGGAVRYRTKTGKQLTVANFSKAKEYVGNLLERPLPPRFRKLAKQLVRSAE